MNLKCVVVVCVLVCVCLLEVMVAINCWYDVNVVMGGVWMWRVSHVIKFLVIVQFCQYSFRVLLLNCFYVRNVTKIQLMNDMTDIKSLDFLIDHQPCKNILIRMWTDMEVTRDLFDSKWSHQSASIIILKCCFCHLKLFPLVRLP